VYDEPRLGGKISKAGAEKPIAATSRARVGLWVDVWWLSAKLKADLHAKEGYKARQVAGGHFQAMRLGGTWTCKVE
jgi:hypothetical protein